MQRYAFSKVDRPALTQRWDVFYLFVEMQLYTAEKEEPTCV